MDSADHYSRRRWWEWFERNDQPCTAASHIEYNDRELLVIQPWSIDRASRVVLLLLLPLLLPPRPLPLVRTDNIHLTVGHDRRLLDGRDVVVTMNMAMELDDNSMVVVAAEAFSLGYSAVFLSLVLTEAHTEHLDAALVSLHRGWYLFLENTSVVDIEEWLIEVDVLARNAAIGVEARVYGGDNPAVVFVVAERVFVADRFPTAMSTVDSVERATDVREGTARHRFGPLGRRCADRVVRER